MNVELKNFNPDTMTEFELLYWINTIGPASKPKIASHLFPFDTRKWKLTKLMREYCLLQLERLKTDDSNALEIRNRQREIYRLLFEFPNLNWKKWITKEIMFNDLYEKPKQAIPEISKAEQKRIKRRKKTLDNE